MNLLRALPDHSEEAQGGYLDRDCLWKRPDVALSDAAWDRSRHHEERFCAPAFPAIVLMREGAFLERVGGRMAVGDPAQATLYNRKWEFRISHSFSDATRGTTFVLDPSLLARMLEDHGIDPGPDPASPFAQLTVHVSPRAHLLYLALVRYLRRDDVDELLAEEMIHRLLGLVLRGIPGAQAPRAAGNRRLHRKLIDVQEILAERSPERIRLSQVAASLGCTPEYASRTFARTVGMTLSRYVVRLRLRRAADRMLQGDSRLTDLALESGFASHSHFTAAFTREFGFPPSSFRRGPARDRAVRALHFPD